MVVDRLLELLTASVLVFLESAILFQALLWYRDVPGLHFADAYIAALSPGRGAAILTFDERMRRVPGVETIDTPGRRGEADDNR